MTYNILLGGRRGPLNDVVRRSAPDILLVNECPKQPFTWRRRCERLAAAWGLRFVAGGRPAGSNLILVRFGIAVKSSGSIRLKQPRFQPRRGAAWAQLRVDGRLMGVVSCHLSLDKVRRTEEVEEVIALASVLRGPVVVAGDLNEGPDGASWRRLVRAGFVDHGSDDWPTFPADAPRKRIDALLVRGGLKVRSIGDPGVPSAMLAAGGDHRPVLAVVELV